jgi:hypothetical protein
VRRIVVRKSPWGMWVAGIEGHSMAWSTHETWGEAMSLVPGYIAIRDVEQRSTDALFAAFDREFPATEETR